MDVSIIIVNYKTPRFVIDSIKSINSHSEGFSYEIIVVDNASNDGSVDLIKKECQDAIIISSNENLGTSKAYNLAISHSRGDYIFLLNPDTLLLNNAIFLMLQFISNNENVATVCGNLYDLDKNPTHSYHLRPLSLKTIKKSASLLHLISIRFNRRKFHDQFNYTDKPIEVGYACAAAMLISKTICQKVGFFDESIFMYGEESALAYKLRKLGFITMNIPDAAIVHFEGGSFADKKDLHFSPTRYRRFIRGNYAAFNITEGLNGGENYYKILLKNEKKYSFLFSFYSKAKYLISKQKIQIIEEEMKRYQK